MPTSTDAVSNRHALGDLIWSQTRTAHLVRLFAIPIAFLFGLATLRLPLETLQSPHLYRKDFLQEYILARAIAGGVNPYLPIPELAGQFLGAVDVPMLEHPTPHPPTAGLLLLPLAGLDYTSAAAIWMLFELSCLVASVYFLGRVAGIRLNLLATFVCAGIALVWYPFPQDLALGQLILPILLLLVGALQAMYLGMHSLGGAMIGLSLLLKPIAWPLLLVLLVRREGRAFAAALLVALLGYVSSVLIVGLDPILVYFTQVIPSVTSLYQVAPGNISAWSIGWRLFEGIHGANLAAPPLVQSTPAAAAVSAGLPALILVASLVAIQRQQSLSRSLGFMCCISILVSPIAWNYYLALVAIPMAQIGGWTLRRRLPSRETNVILLVALLLSPKDEWARLALAAAGQSFPPDGSPLIPFAPALLTLGPAVAVAAVAVLLVTLPMTSERRARPEGSTEDL